MNKRLQPQSRVAVAAALTIAVPAQAHAVPCGIQPTRARRQRARSGPRPT